MTVSAIIQARMNSKRLPGKIMMKIKNKPILEILINRINHCKTLDKIIVATTEEKSDDEIGSWAENIAKSKSPNEISFINEQILGRKPDSEDRLQYFNEIRDKIDPSRLDVTTWVDLLDLEEGRLPPKNS